MNGVSSILPNPNTRSYSLIKEKLIKNSSLKINPLIQQIRVARKKRNRMRLKVDPDELKTQIKRVTQSQSILLEKLKESRASRLQSSSSQVKLEDQKARLMEHVKLPIINKNNQRLKTSKKNATLSTIKPKNKPEKRSFLPSVHMLVHRSNQSMTKHRNSSNNIIENARKAEKLSRVREFVLKSENTFTEKSIELEKDINQSLIKSIKAKMSVYLNKLI